MPSESGGSSRGRSSWLFCSGPRHRRASSRLLSARPARPTVIPAADVSNDAVDGAVCQSALVASGWLAAMLMRELIQALNAAMLEAPDPEVVQVSDQLARAREHADDDRDDARLTSGGARGVGSVLRPSSNAAGQFGRDEAPGTVELPNLEANYKEEPFVAFSAEAVAPKSSVMLPGHYAGWALMGLGVLMLLFAVMDSCDPSGVRDVHTRARRVGAGGTAGDPGHVQRCAGLALDAVARLPARRAQYRRHLPRCAGDQPVGVQRSRGAHARSHSSAAGQRAVSGSRTAYPTSAASSGTARSSSAWVSRCPQTTTA